MLSGPIAMLDSTGRPASDVYLAYKTRGEIETAVDSWKNRMEADRTYMQNSFSLEGWMSVNHIALQWYYHILNLFKNHKLNAQFSINDFIKRLMEIKTVKIKDKWRLAEITNAAAELLAKLEIIPDT